MGFFDVFKRNGTTETPKGNHTDYSRYLQYTFNPWKPGADKRTVVNMRYAGWKMLLGEALSEDIERELGLRYLGNGIWADDYVNHCRKRCIENCLKHLCNKRQAGCLKIRRTSNR